MLELIYDNDVQVSGQHHTLEVYADAQGREALAVFMPDARGVAHGCRELLDYTRDALRHFAPAARWRVLLASLPDRRFSLMEDEPPPPHWRELPEDEVRASGLVLI